MLAGKKAKTGKEFTHRNESYELSEIKPQRSEACDGEDIESGVGASRGESSPGRMNFFQWFIAWIAWIAWCFGCKKEKRAQDQLIDAGQCDSEGDRCLSRHELRPTKTSPELYAEEREILPRILCECGEININEPPSSAHECVLNCPWILEGCLFSVSHNPLGKSNPNFQQIFEVHFQNHSDFDSKTAQVKSSAIDPSSHRSYQQITDDEPGGSSHPPIAKIKRKCGDFPMGVQGCEEEVFAEELQAHLERPEFLQKHMDLILN